MEDKSGAKTRSPQEVLDHLRNEGSKVPIDFDAFELVNEKPVWFEESKFKRAKDVVWKYLLGIEFSSITGLLLILQIPDALEPLLTTGNSKDVPSLFRRYLATAVYVRSWYVDDIFDPSTKGYKNIRLVRGMHRRVQEMMNNKFQVKDLHGNGKLWMNQCEVALTQFGFIGLAMAFPEKSGLIAASEEELELINYYWRVLGREMGLKDEFNLCQFDKYSDIKEFNRLILEQEYKARFEREPCKVGLEMGKGIISGLTDFLPMITFNTLAHWWKDQFSFNGYEPQPLSARERILLTVNNLTFNSLLKYEPFIKLSQKAHVKRFNRRLKNKDKIYQKIKKRYGDRQELTFYSERKDYFGPKAESVNHMEGAKIAPSSGCPLGFGASNIDSSNHGAIAVN